MLGMVFAIPTVFGLVVWRSFRSETARRARGDHVGTPGALRWTAGERERSRRS
jgi:hypothetical protein